ncbi:hypothetical protein COCVIDRAFT_86018 [Bipolaris victoriae FI3]|uniref:Uncharacterized protein n=2 Tax=Bipolaris TaxID=33194 RepID=W6YIU2_COCC2|nr:uncharacterized protein COCCADRAFT_80549 [Bipolaris zeicola 26-R-13]XP_014561746.1 hypothetical protein COCVIDRAFT_86018 [Bipolaris victoriae FI3]EUC39237.1 hypothetical protein COCCADRAFT_80549 [Bipolaris zeicola 26-R-13]
MCRQVPGINQIEANNDKKLGSSIFCSFCLGVLLIVHCRRGQSFRVRFVPIVCLMLNFVIAQSTAESKNLAVQHCDIFRRVPHCGPNSALC